MASGKVAICFANCLGNFILMTAALKILRKTYKKIDMITDQDILIKHPAVEAMALFLFDDVKTSYHPEFYDKVFCADWSIPECVPVEKTSLLWSTGKSDFNGVHEVQIYLDMIDSEAFDGFLVPLANKPILNSEKIKIVLANSSVYEGSRKGALTGWQNFPELSVILQDLGYQVVLVGKKDELKGCVGLNFVDKLNIFETSYVISQCDLMISVDTGLMHIAGALGVPMILLAGPTPVTKVHPIISDYKVVRKFISCAPCYQTALWSLCKDPVCMRQIEVNDVLSQVFSSNLKKAFKEIQHQDKLSFDLSLHPHPDTTILKFPFHEIDEVVYNPTHDMLGDLFGAVFVLRWLKDRYPKLRISWYRGKSNTRQGTEWFSNFNVLDWIDLKIHKFYDDIPSNKLVISSCGDFHVWHDLICISKNLDWYPKIDKKVSFLDLPDKYVVLHILQPTDNGDRNGSYVKRRSLDFEKYEKLAYALEADDISVVRIGASYDMVRKIDGIIDLSGDLSLDESLRVVSGAAVFIGGDTGLKLVANTMNIPCVVEIDAKSKSIGGLGGCDPKYLKAFPMKTSKESLLTAVKGLL